MYVKLLQKEMKVQFHMYSDVQKYQFSESTRTSTGPCRIRKQEIRNPRRIATSVVDFFNKIIVILGARFCLQVVSLPLFTFPS